MLQNTPQKKIYMQVIPSIYNKSFKLEIVQKASPTYKCHTYRKEAERQSRKVLH